MTAKDKNLNDLFLDTLKDIYYAEKQILKALPKMAKAASSDKLRAAFEKHHGETEGQVERLEQIFELIDKPARGKTCDAIQGILDEGKEIMEEYKGCEALDAGMLAAAQAVEHYEISRYGTLKQWARQLGIKDAVRLLDQTLQEERKTDESSDLAGRGGGEFGRRGLNRLKQACGRALSRPPTPLVPDALVQAACAAFRQPSKSVSLSRVMRCMGLPYGEEHPLSPLQ